MPIPVILSIIPVLAALLILFFPQTKKPQRIKHIAFIFSLLPLIFLLYFSWTRTLTGAEVDYVWIKALSIHFHLAIDPLSSIFLYITAIVIPFSLLAINDRPFRFINGFCSLILVLQGLLLIFFMAKDLALFTIFWEAILLPVYFIMNLAGGTHRQGAAVHFLIYMIAGSALMVAAVLGLYYESSIADGQGTFNLHALEQTAKTARHAGILGAIFLLAFSVKTPLFPFHAWLPSAYTQSSTSGTILLSALLSKAGVYGFLRIGLPLFPQQIAAWNPLLLGAAITGVLYGGLIAWQQRDFKRLIAFSSFSHVNFILAGVFALSEVANRGAVLQAINHAGLITALFLLCGWLEERIFTTSMDKVSGLAKYLPRLCWISLFFSLAAVALPGTNNFIGELLIFYGLFAIHPILTFILGLSIILSVMYMLYFMKKIYFSKSTPDFSRLKDMNTKELLIMTPLIILVLWIGIYPKPVLELIWETLK